MRIRHRSILLAATAIWVAADGAAIAQDAAETGAEASAPVTVAQAAPAQGEAPVILAQAGAPRPAAQHVENVTVSARRVDEDVQKVPVPISVVSADTITNTGAYNLNRLIQQLPSVQFFSQNPRNTSINILGIGAPLGLTNDGIEQGVGVYVDQVYYNRIAATTLDFVDVE